MRQHLKAICTVIGSVVLRLQSFDEKSRAVDRNHVLHYPEVVAHEFNSNRLMNLCFKPAVAS